MLYRLFLLIFLIASALSVSSAQTPVRPPSSLPSADRGQRDNDDYPIGSPEQEMLARRNIKAAEKDFKENLERAREAAQLGAEIRDAFLNNKMLGRVEIKKLERLEKITRKIRSEAGGSAGDITLKNPPTQIGPALSCLAEASGELRKRFEKTSRHVVSAAVIEQANEVLEVLRYIRDLAPSN